IEPLSSSNLSVAGGTVSAAAFDKVLRHPLLKFMIISVIILMNLFAGAGHLLAQDNHVVMTGHQAMLGNTADSLSVIQPADSLNIPVVADSLNMIGIETPTAQIDSLTALIVATQQELNEYRGIESFIKANDFNKISVVKDSLLAGYIADIRTKIALDTDIKINERDSSRTTLNMNIGFWSAERNNLVASRDSLIAVNDSLTQGQDLELRKADIDSTYSFVETTIQEFTQGKETLEGLKTQMQDVQKKLRALEVAQFGNGEITIADINREAAKIDILKSEIEQNQKLFGEIDAALTNPALDSLDVQSVPDRQLKRNINAIRENQEQAKELIARRLWQYNDELESLTENKNKLDILRQSLEAISQLVPQDDLDSTLTEIEKINRLIEKTDSLIVSQTDKLRNLENEKCVIEGAQRIVSENNAMIGDLNEEIGLFDAVLAQMRARLDRLNETKITVTADSDLVEKALARVAEIIRALEEKINFYNQELSNLQNLKIVKPIESKEETPVVKEPKPVVVVPKLEKAQDVSENIEPAVVDTTKTEEIIIPQGTTAVVAPTKDKNIQTKGVGVFRYFAAGFAIAGLMLYRLLNRKNASKKSSKNNSKIASFKGRVSDDEKKKYQEIIEEATTKGRLKDINDPRVSLVLEQAKNLIGCYEVKLPNEEGRVKIGDGINRKNIFWVQVLDRSPPDAVVLGEDIYLILNEEDLTGNQVAIILVHEIVECEIFEKNIDTDAHQFAEQAHKNFAQENILVNGENNVRGKIVRVSKNSKDVDRRVVDKILSLRFLEFLMDALSDEDIDLLSEKDNAIKKLLKRQAWISGFKNILSSMSLELINKNYDVNLLEILEKNMSSHMKEELSDYKIFGRSLLDIIKERLSDPEHFVLGYEEDNTQDALKERLKEKVKSENLRLKRCMDQMLARMKRIFEGSATLASLQKVVESVELKIKDINSVLENNTDKWAEEIILDFLNNQLNPMIEAFSQRLETPSLPDAVRAMVSKNLS
ncbi:MAG TPA: hypothetical protein PKH98_02235, partial [Candidatus Omnitrophota bacterium]|nr:hypothetical protein [Candidatus Omnitrophota bacterium]